MGWGGFGMGCDWCGALISGDQSELVDSMMVVMMHRIAVVVGNVWQLILR
jgi:hypothetical protein